MRGLDDVFSADLRRAWHSQQVVHITLNPGCSVSEVRGKVERVSVTDAFVVVRGFEIPIECIRELRFLNPKSA
jgi:hypothetical protein